MYVEPGSSNRPCTFQTSGSSATSALRRASDLRSSRSALRNSAHTGRLSSRLVTNQGTWATIKTEDLRSMAAGEMLGPWQHAANVPKTRDMPPRTDAAAPRAPSKPQALRRAKATRSRDPSCGSVATRMLAKSATMCQALMFRRWRSSGSSRVFHRFVRTARA